MKPILLGEGKRQRHVVPTGDEPGNGAFMAYSELLDVRREARHAGFGVLEGDELHV